MGEPIRVLHVVTYMGRGGLESMIMNYYRNIDRSKVQFDFLTHRYERWDYDDEIEKLGGKIYHLPRLNPFSPKYLKALDNFFKDHKEYKIVHCHQDCLSGVILKYAKKNGVPSTIAHSHSSNQNKNFKYIVKLIAKKSMPEYADYLFACGEESGKWMFNTSNFIILNNAIDSKRYIYNEEKSLKVKERLGITNKFVIGHVGRFRQEKNHSFIIDIFKEVCKKEPNAALLLIGDGLLEEEIKKKVKSLELLDKVKFLGTRDDVNDLMQGMDVFILPSLYEGIPLTMIESQASGLNCIISDKVPKECIVTKNVKRISIEEDPKYWANEIIKIKNKIRKNLYNEIQDAKFDIKSNAIWLQEFYLENMAKGD
ncbi:glycosyltransferase family 1 protein [Terrisporobacter mayombei]|uniref:Glycosyltransferase EpsF n=1 Tax=Terrisporobacter mayombei TaxID=1541 RepID=A0ABY9Q864_9FIRM|nr:glycosyltransferase family 1 protein [Terrisporobacter mayombei]MCC3869662.1 glycosyltransferase family 1 protein [Terrisporobacter mayombei]WMT83400.1 Putative glycosyltransferase EpsF [Terrisporobacter mayombei]